MKITAVTKFKHGLLWEALRQAKWSQSELARRCGIGPSRLGMMVMLRACPTAQQADAIQRAFGEVGVYFDPLAAWPSGFKPLRQTLTVEETRNVEFVALETCPEAFQLEAPTADAVENELADSLAQMLDRLDPQERDVVERCVMDGETPSHVARDYRMTPTGVILRRNRAIRKLRRPSMLKCLCESDEAYDVANWLADAPYLP